MPISDRLSWFSWNFKQLSVLCRQDMKKYSLEITVFLSGAIVMMLELTGSRILAPFVGTSTFIWTSLIGVILASLSLGYYHGGKKADEDPSHKRLSQILFLAGVCIGTVAVVNQTILSTLVSSMPGIRWTAAVSACILFGPPAYLLGMVSPLAVRIRMTDVQTSGSTIGRLYALSSLGSIMGTFLVGFYLTALVGSRNILFILCVMSILLSALNFRNKEQIMALLVFLAAPVVSSFGKSGLLKIRDTDYNAIQVITSPHPHRDSPVCRIMKLGNEYSSGMYLDSDSLAFPYSKFYKLIYHFSPNPETALLIGGGAYSVPKYFQAHDPDLQMDVLEIDPALTRIAEEEFNFRRDGKKIPIHEDGRIFLNQNKKKYDAILGDAYQSLFSIPFHLVSEEAMKGMRESLSDNGVLIINILCQVKGENRDLLHSMVKTCRSIFPYVRAFKPRTDLGAERVQNIMIVCMKTPKPALPAAISPETAWMLQQEIDLSDVGTDQGIVLRDDFAPVEHYAEKLLDTYYRK